MQHMIKYFNMKSKSKLNALFYICTLLLLKQTDNVNHTTITKMILVMEINHQFKGNRGVSLEVQSFLT